MSSLYRDEDILLAELQLQPLVDRLSAFRRRRRLDVCRLTLVELTNQRAVLDDVILDDGDDGGGRRSSNSSAAGRNTAAAVDNDDEAEAPRNRATVAVTDAVRRWVQQSRNVDGGPSADDSGISSDPASRWVQQMTSSSAAQSADFEETDGGGFGVGDSDGVHGFWVTINCRGPVDLDLSEPLLNDDGDDVFTGDDDEDGTLLVVFSNDRKRRKTEQREIHELETRELEAAPADMLMTSSAGDYEFYDDDDETPEQGGQEEVEGGGGGMGSSIDGGSLVSDDVDLEPEVTSQRRRRRRRRRAAGPQKRGKRHRKGKNACRRRPMYINFADIHWDNWIIAPKGYQVIL